MASSEPRNRIEHFLMLQLSLGRGVTLSVWLKVAEEMRTETQFDMDIKDWDIVGCPTLLRPTGDGMTVGDLLKKGALATSISVLLLVAGFLFLMYAFGQRTSTTLGLVAIYWVKRRFHFSSKLCYKIVFNSYSSFVILCIIQRVVLTRGPRCRLDENFLITADAQ